MVTKSKTSVILYIYLASMSNSGGTPKVNGEFSGLDYIQFISSFLPSLFSILRFSLPIFHHSRLQPLAKAFFSGTTGAGLMGSVNTSTTNKSF